MKSTRRKASRVALVVLGMHRSGTSALAGTLTLLGCDGPATPMKATPDNAKGYFEPAPLYPLHSKLLESAASSWDDWLPIGESWMNSVRAEEFQARAATLIEEQFGTSRLFVLKDPRICRLVPFWAKVFDDLGIAPGYVLTHRNPLEVARSLNARDGMEVEVALLIWLRYVLGAEAATRGKRRCFTSYAELMTSWNHVGQKIEAALKVSLPRLSPQVADELDAFLSAELRHQTVPADKALTDARTTGWVQTVFAILEKWVAGGEAAEDYATLDQVRQQFDSSASAYARPMRLVQSAQRQLKVLGADAARLATEKESLAKEVETLRAAQAKATAEVERRLQQQLSAQKAELDAAREDLKGARNELKEKTASFVEARERQNAAILQARAERDRIAAERKDLEARFEQLRAGRAELEKQLKEQGAALDAERARQRASDEAQSKAQDQRIAALELDLATTRGALDERRMTVAQAETALAEMRDRLTESEAAHERALTEAETAAAQRLRDAEAALDALSDEMSRNLAAVTAEKDALDVKVHERGAALRRAAAAKEAMQERHAKGQEALKERRDALKAELAAREASLAQATAELEALRQDRAQAVADLEGTVAELRTALDAREAASAADSAALEQVGADRDRLQGELTRALSALAEQEAALAALKDDSTQAIAELESTVSALRESLDDRSATALAAEEALERVQELLAAREAELAQTQSALEQRRHELDQNSQAMARLQADLEAAQAMLLTAETNAGERESALIGRLADRETLVRRLEHSLDERNRELAELTQLIARRETETADALRTAAERAAAVTALDAELASARKALEQSETAASERETALIGQMHDRETSLSRAEQGLADRHREFAHLTQLVVAREAERDEQARAAAARATEIETLKRRMAEVQSERDAHASYIEALFASRSWKATKPLRDLTTALRRVLRRGE